MTDASARFRMLALSAVTFAAAALAGCTAASAPATWEITVTPKPESTSIPIEVTRLECASGSTGEVAGANVTYEERRILIEALVVPLPLEAYNCQGNDVTPYNVQLEQPLGDRELVDTVCLDETNSLDFYCADGGVRWSPPVAE